MESLLDERPWALRLEAQGAGATLEVSGEAIGFLAEAELRGTLELLRLSGFALLEPGLGDLSIELDDLGEPRQHGPNGEVSALDVAEVLGSLGSSTKGLTEAESAQRLSEYGPNLLTPPEPRSALLRFLSQFDNLLIYILLAAGVVTVLLGHFVDAGVIFGVVLINSSLIRVRSGRDDVDEIAIPVNEIAIEAGSAQGWHRFVGDAGRVVALDHFGASAPAQTLFEKFGLTAERVVEKALECV